MKLLALALIGMVIIGQATGSPRGASGLEYNEPYRPQYHFSPPSHWMNDPNGLVFLDGEYHLFYQYNPNATVWGPMHWGHAVSTDMVHWDNLPIALYPDDLGTIFSGSTIYDKNNTSGLGTVEHPPLVAIFTQHNHRAETAARSDFQNQSLAYSLDKGRTWTKYSANPVLKNPGSRDFRDPKVSWFEAGQKWIMTLAVADHVAFYSSHDLKSWVYESDFGRDRGAHGGVWECPDLIPMTIDAEGLTKYLLLVSVNPGGPNGGSATQYFIGAFDGHHFVPDPESSRSAQNVQDATPSARWVDYGTDDYAGVTWSGIPQTDGRHLFIGWMSNWTYAREVPSEHWRSAMTLPRELKLVRTPRGLELRSTPVAELTGLRRSTQPIAMQKVQQEVTLTRSGQSESGLLELELTLDTHDAQSITMEFANSHRERTLFRINSALQRFELDRSKSGMINFNQHFAQEQFAPIPATSTVSALRIFLDRSSVEIFVNQGETVLTAIVFPSTPYTTITLRSDQPMDLKSGALYQLRSIWKKQ